MKCLLSSRPTGLLMILGIPCDLKQKNTKHMKTLFSKYIFLLILAASAFSCSDNEVPFDPTVDLIKIDEGFAIGAATKVEVWSSQDLMAGYNNIFIALYDSVGGSRITKAKIDFYPEMSMMGGVQHGCPVEEPAEEAVNQLFPGAITFTMPSGDMGSWKLKIEVQNQVNNKKGSTTFSISVANPTAACLKSFVTAANEKIFVTYNFPKKMKVGINDLDVIVYKMINMYEFAYVENYSFVLTPEMPSMGHGSPNNVNPTHASKGHYKGKVNFTMTGDWRLNLNISQGEAVVKDLYFDVEVE
jgi:hypothetical protein